MLKWFGNLFQKKNIEPEAPNYKVDAYTTDNLDEIFAEYFTHSGGFFNYVPDLKSGLNILQIILEQLDPDQIYCTQPELQKLLKTLNYPYSDKLMHESDLALLDCENLIARDGSIMVSSDNIQNHKISELPKNIIFISNTGQIVPNRSKGLEKIRRKKGNKLPANITSLNGKKSQEFLKKEYLKELYLVLVEQPHK